MLRYFLEKLKATPDADGTLFDSTLVLYGSPMGDPNLHNHKRVPFCVVAPPSATLPGAGM